MSDIKGLRSIIHPNRNFRAKPSTRSPARSAWRRGMNLVLRESTFNNGPEANSRRVSQILISINNLLIQGIGGQSALFPSFAHGCLGKTKIAVSEDDRPDSRPFAVMAGLLPAIPRRMRSIRPRAAPLQTSFEVRDGFWAWMPGTRPGMTCVGLQNVQYCNRNQPPGRRLGTPPTKSPPHPARASTSFTMSPISRLMAKSFGV